MLAEKVQNTYVAIKKIQIYRQIKDWFWANTIYQAKVNLNDIQYNDSSEELFLPSFQIKLYKENQKYHFLLKESNVRLAKRLAQQFKAEFSVNENQELIVAIEGIKARILTEQDLEIVKEIFEQGVYNFIDNGELVAIDIGMNVGLASLYFASRNNIKAVYSFEPFKVTFQNALDNFQLNPDLKSKINPFEYGLSDRQETMTVEFNESVKASIGLEGVPQYIQKNQIGSVIKEDILIKDVTEVLTPIFDKHEGIDFMAKIDCEGSEYNIFESLDQANLLRKFKIIIMEWHEKGPQKLEDYLQKNGFTVFSRRPKSTTIGMIYAVRS